jgi:hypothetical protein
MNLATHIVFILGNIIISVFASIVALSTFPEIGVYISYLIGGGVFLLGGQIHIVYAIKANNEDMTTRLLALHQDNQVYLDQIEQTRDETTQLKEQLKATEHASNKEIVNEIRLLQTLLNQVVEKSGKSFSKALKEPKSVEHNNIIER